MANLHKRKPGLPIRGGHRRGDHRRRRRGDRGAPLTTCGRQLPDPTSGVIGSPRSTAACNPWHERRHRRHRDPGASTPASRYLHHAGSGRDRGNSAGFSSSPRPISAGANVMVLGTAQEDRLLRRARRRPDQHLPHAGADHHEPNDIITLAQQPQRRAWPPRHREARRARARRGLRPIIDRALTNAGQAVSEQRLTSPTRVFPSARGTRSPTSTSSSIGDDVQRRCCRRGGRRADAHRPRSTLDSPGTFSCTDRALMDFISGRGAQRTRRSSRAST